MYESNTDMNHEQSYNVLFVDDEFDDTKKVELHNAVRNLRKCGYTVDTFLTMGEAINAFVGGKFYHVMIVDIDMQRTLHRDALTNMEMQSGRDLAKVYMSLDNGCRVIIYSGAGTEDDMFNVANCHVYGYVQKKSGGGPDKLVEKVKAALANTDMGLRISHKKEEGKILTVEDGVVPFTTEEWESILSSVQGNFTRVAATISHAKDLLARDHYAAIIIAAQTFSIHDLDDLKKICAVQPRPHVVMACDITPQNRGTILNVVNLRPLRLVDLSLQNKVQKMTEALQSALTWYDGWETFQSSLKYVREVSERFDWSAYEDDNLVLTEELVDEYSDGEDPDDSDESKENE